MRELSVLCTGDQLAINKKSCAPAWSAAETRQSCMPGATIDLTRKEKTLNSQTYICLTCKDNPKFSDTKEMFSHLREVHNIKSEPIRGTKKLTTHMDGQGWYSNTYDVEIEGIELVGTVVVER
jgi:aspartyl-tRNA synthetase